MLTLSELAHDFALDLAADAETTVVKNEANAIAEYLTRIGETNFAGGMEKQP